MRADPAHRHLVVFARGPRLGAGKRRLASAIGELGALRFQRFALKRLLRTLRDDARWTLWLALTPDRAPGRRSPRQIGQGGGDLGMRLTRLMRRLPRGQVLVIGADAPQIRRRDVRDAFQALDRRGAVLGPARDGGFWLVGLDRRARRRPPFDDVRWSSPHALADVVAGYAPAKFAFLHELDDVDDVDALRKVMAAMHGRRS